MTRNESFKRRIRERMAKTGEKYGAARRVLIDQAASAGGRRWVSDPDQSDAAVRRATGRGWDEWCDAIDSSAVSRKDRAAVTAWLQEEHDLDGWWAMSVALGWERISGRRQRYEKPDGTFTANRSSTITTDHVALRAMLIDEGDRPALLPGLRAELRSRPTSKTIRLGVEDGIVQIVIEPKGDGRATVYVEHAKLPNPEDVAHWKAFWTDWLAALDEARP